MFHRIWAIASLTLFLVTAWSCTLQATLVLKSNGGAEASAALRLDAPTRNAWSSLRDLDDTLPSDPLDPALLGQGLGTQGRVDVSGEVTTLRLPVDDLRKFVPTWRTQGTSWEGTLDRQTIRRWAQLTSWANSPALDSLLPAPGTKITEAEYRDLLVYLLGAGVSETKARALVDGSTVQLTLVAPKAIRSAPGAVSVSDRTAVYRWPLTRVLVLDPPIKIQLNF